MPSFQAPFKPDVWNTFVIVVAITLLIVGILVLGPFVWWLLS